MSMTVVAPPVVARLGLISVDSSVSLEESIRHCRLDYIQPDILNVLPQLKVGSRPGKNRIEISIAHFNRSIGLLSVIRELSHLGFQGADFPELLSVCVHFPSLQCQFPLIAAGACCRNKGGDCGVPYLWYGHRTGNRTLLLNWAAGHHDRLAREFQPFCRFVVMPKNPAEQSAS